MIGIGVESQHFFACERAADIKNQHSESEHCERRQQVDCTKGFSFSRLPCYKDAVIILVEIGHIPTDIQNDISTDLPDVLSTVEKEDIEHYCGLINSSLQNIKRQAEALERKQREISDLTFVLENSLPKNRHSRIIWHRQKVKVLWKPERKWKIPNPEWVKARRRYKEYQENESKKLIENADSNYNQLEKYCRKMTHQLITKQDLDPSIKAIYEIIQKIGDKKYKATTPETFSYSALSLLVSDYQNRYRRLLIFIQGK